VRQVTETDCVFCRIASGALPAHVVAEDDDCIAFLDHRPAALGHTLVLPREHIEVLWEADPDQAGSLLRLARDVSAVLHRRLGCDGLTLRQNNGAASGQEVPHLHFHLVPRWHGDGHIGWPRPMTGEYDPIAVLAQLVDER
jgi:histidine triad (HIT) family protein